MNPNMHLKRNLKDKEKLEMLPTRDGYGHGVVLAGEKDERVVVLCADLTDSTRSAWFKEKFPERFVEIGVAEQNLATVGAGMANYGKIPFISSYAAFSPGRNYEQIRTTIALNNVPVKVVGAHAGISVGPDGATHQMLEDVAMMRALPRMTVLVPCDAEEAQKATVEAAQIPGPVYIRIAREKSPVFTTKKTPFKVGRAEVYRDGSDVAIIASGSLLYNALVAAEELEEEGISARVINNHTVKPMDEKTILKAAKETGAIVTVEEHQINGGMGSAVSEYLAQTHPTPQEFIGIHDHFGESGTAEELMEKFGLDTKTIKEKVKSVLKRK